MLACLRWIGLLRSFSCFPLYICISPDFATEFVNGWCTVAGSIAAGSALRHFSSAVKGLIGHLPLLVVLAHVILLLLEVALSAVSVLVLVVAAPASIVAVAVAPATAPTTEATATVLVLVLAKVIELIRMAIITLIESCVLEARVIGAKITTIAHARSIWMIEIILADIP
jgi:hypothetical protein